MRRQPMDLTGFLVNAPKLFSEEATSEEEIDPDIASGEHAGAIRRFDFDNGDKLSCIRWDTRFHITSTDIIKALVHRFKDIHRPVVNMKKFEEGVFSDLRSLKPGVDARLEMPRSEFLELLHKHHCVRTQKKQKVFYWESVPHDMLFREALERDLKREAMGVETTTKTENDVDPSSVVVIGGIELPLSVPPTLAVHPRIATEPAGSCATTTSPSVRVSSAHVSSSTACLTTATQAPSLVEGKKPTNSASTMSAGTGSRDKNLGSSVLSLASLASSSHGDDNDGNNAPYPDNRSSVYTDPADVLRISTTTCSPMASVPITAPAVLVANDNFSSQQMRQYINQHQHQQAPGFGNQDYPGIDFLNGGVSQPSLSEYISGKTASVASSNNDGYSGRDINVGASSSSLDMSAAGAVAPINGSWTGMDFQQLHKKASELRANYSEYQPTPTPHHSPKCGAANGQELSDLLSSDPNALVTEDNIGDFNALLEKLLGDSNSLQESIPSQGALQASSSDCDATSNGLLSTFGQIQFEQQQSRQQQAYLENIFGAGALSGINVGQIPSRSMSGIGMDVDISSAANSSGRAPSSAAMGMVESINSSPMAASMMHSQHITPNQTPEVTNSMQFESTGALRSNSTGMGISRGNSHRGFIESAQTLSADGFSNVFVQQPASSGLPAAFGLSASASSRNATDSGYANSSEQSQASSAFAASLAEARNNLSDNAKSLEILKSLWFSNQPSNVPTPRSTRFSRYHPYLKTMARIAHRESPTLVNRVPSTANPTVAAAAVNVIAAKLNREQQAASVAASSASISATLSVGTGATSMSTSGISTQHVSANPNASGANIHNAASLSSSRLDSAATAAVANGNDPQGPSTESTDALFASGQPAAAKSKGTADADSSTRQSKRVSANDGSGANDDEQPRRYACEYAGCNKQFKRHEHLKRHFRVHTGERPYKCPAPDCDKVFARMDNLNQHVRTHVNRKTANRRTSGTGGATIVGNEKMTHAIAATPHKHKEALGAASALDDMASLTAQSVAATADVSSPAYVLPEANERMSLFSQGVARAVESLGASSGISSIPLSSALVSFPGTARRINGANVEEQALAGGSNVLTAQQLEMLSQGRSANAEYPMRAEPPEELPLSSRGWLSNGNNSAVGGQYQSTMPMQSPSIENNAVAMLRKLTKNNRLRNAGLSPAATPSRSTRDRLDSPFSPDAILSLGASPSVLPMSGMFGGIDVNGFAFSQEARLTRQDGGNSRSAVAGREVASSSQRGVDYSVGPSWLDTFFSQQQQSLSMAASEAVSAQPVGFGAQWNSGKPSAYLEEQRKMANVNGDVGMFPRSLKRHLEDGYENQDVTMAGNGSHRSLSTSGDEMNVGSAGASDAHVNKLVRSGIMPSSHVHQV
ncbi:hypothetical protein LPJ75_001143 [Coemansia sp. RSA 2598]|nr:hypothetical protein LPJ75_001143 [Coemansia sp. RSA 2598]